MKMGFKIEQSTENLTAHAGISLIGQLLAKTALSNRLNQTAIGATDCPNISNADVIFAYLGQLAQAKTDFGHIEAFRQDDVFKKMLNIQTVPSDPTLRQRLEQAPTSWNEVIQEEAIFLLSQAHIALTPWRKSGLHRPDWSNRRLE